MAKGSRQQPHPSGALPPPASSTGPTTASSSPPPLPGAKERRFQRIRDSSRRRPRGSHPVQVPLALQGARLGMPVVPQVHHPGSALFPGRAASGTAAASGVPQWAVPAALNEACLLALPAADALSDCGCAQSVKARLNMRGAAAFRTVEDYRPRRRAVLMGADLISGERILEGPSSPCTKAGPTRTPTTPAATVHRL